MICKNEKEKMKHLINISKDKRKLKTVDDGFNELLNLGRYFEDMAIEKVIMYHNLKDDTLINKNNNIYYDFEIENIGDIDNVKYEVKTDIKAVETNNIFVEFMSNNRDSGINKSMSNYYIIIIPYEEEPLFLMIKTLTLRDLILNRKYDRIFNPTLYNKFTGGYIFNVECIKIHSIIL